MPTTEPRRQVILGAGFPHGSPWIIWDDPEAGSQTDFASFERAARIAEDAGFDFFMLAEALKQREHKGGYFETEIAGRPHSLTALTALAAVTRRIGLVATLSTTYNEPWELARQISTLDHLSGGRAAWNLVTTSDPASGINFRRGAFLPHPERYRRAAEFVAVARRLWESWPPEDLAGDAAAGAFLARPDAGGYAFRGDHFDISGRFPLPRSPQRQPVLLQAGDSPTGRDFAVANADIVFSMHAEPEAGRLFRADVRARAAAAGRDPDSIKVLPGTQFILGDSLEDAKERSREVARRQITAAGALARLEAVFGRDLTGYDPDDPLPPLEDPGDRAGSAGYKPGGATASEVARQWHEHARRNGLSGRQLVIDLTLRHTFLGTPSQVAAQIDEAVRSGAADGYVLTGLTLPTGLAEFAEKVVPELRERGVFRTEYEGETLREHLGLPADRWVPAADEALTPAGGRG
jgi:FMN-dependent oxidoreductase (nitrilotriacetate monooxygenase family)